jgi:hypothetical protein
VWPLAVVLAAGVVIDGYVAYRTVAARTLRESYALPFFATGLIGYGLSSTLGSLEAFRSANISWHFHEPHHGPLARRHVRVHHLHRLGSRLRAGLTVASRIRRPSACTSGSRWSAFSPT